MTATPWILQVDAPAGAHAAAVDFWAGALATTPRWPEDADDPYVALDAPASTLEVHVQRLPEGEAGRLHLDLASDDVDADTERLRAAGAEHAWTGPGWEVLRDPAGLLLCVVPRDRLRGRVGACGDGGYLDTVSIDVPEQDHDAVVAFWSSALGETAPRPVDGASPATLVTGVDGPGGRLGVRIEPIPDRARLRVDLSTHDVAGEALRLEQLGGARVAETGTSATLADPAGNLLRLVSR